MAPSGVGEKGASAVRASKGRPGDGSGSTRGPWLNGAGLTAIRDFTGPTDRGPSLLAG